MDGVAPGACPDPERSEGEWVGNAILDACGADLFGNPTTPERVWRALKQKDMS
ncbi:MAG: hypothetical protein M1347_02450 [Chloroflexi bacterium]|nr:hypothetical protein [Chloroflexota bacterium]